MSAVAPPVRRAEPPRAGVAVRVAGSVEALFAAEPALGTSGPQVGYGPLVPDPDGMLDLPRGFRYYDPVPRGHRPSGRAAGAQPVRRHGRLPRRPARGARLVRNHECSPTAPIKVVAPPERTYDPAAAGGTSTLVVDKHDRDDRASTSASAAPRSTAPAASRRGAPG